MTQVPPSPINPIPLQAYLKRFTFVAMALVLAQILYLVLAVMMKLNPHSKFPTTSLSAQPLTDCLLILGIFAAAVSFLIVGRVTPRDLTQLPLSQKTLALQKQFFTGYAISQTAALFGLFLFFLFGNLTILAFLVFVSAAAIIAHFLRVKSILEKSERN